MLKTIVEIYGVHSANDTDEIIRGAITCTVHTKLRAYITSTAWRNKQNNNLFRQTCSNSRHRFDGVLEIQ